MSLRSLPSVDRLSQAPLALEWMRVYGRGLVLEAIRNVLEAARLKFSKTGELPMEADILEQVGELLQGWTRPSLITVINATGVILHTNLGRAPLSDSAIRAMESIAHSYSNLEYDIETGRRGSRLVHAEELLKHITQAEAALVVNNNAAAVLLVLMALARKKGVVISRTQLVEIGGGFRVPDVMTQSGARLVEVGTTNRVHLTDYEAALEAGNIALVMHAHRSNFRIVGFTSEPALAELATVAHRVGLPLVDDLGSGSLFDTNKFGLGHEPTVQESLESGADLVCFSGDKLLGGPQAGIILGRLDLVTRLRKHPFARAIRADKLCLAALSATLFHYLKGEAEREVPVWRMVALSQEEIKARAQSWANQLGQGEVVAGHSTVGGGSLPGDVLPTCLLALKVHSPNRFLARLHACQPPVIARLEEDKVVLDPRTVLPEQDPVLLSALLKTLEQ